MTKHMEMPPHVAAIDEVQVEQDRTYFLLNPGNGAYVREWIPGEFYPIDESAIGVLDDPILARRLSELRCYVEVNEVEPGIRQRLTLFDLETVVRALAAVRGIELPKTLTPPGVTPLSEAQLRHAKNVANRAKKKRKSRR